MKKSLLFLFVSVWLVSCSNSQSGSGSTETEKEAKKITKRDISITPAVSYSELFVDSMTVEQFIVEKQISDSISRRIRSFYNARNYQYAWFCKDGLTEQARGFWNLHDYQNTYGSDSSLKDKALQKRMDNLITEEKLVVGASDKSFINTELTLTSHFIQYMLSNYEKGYVKRKEMEKFVPFKKQDPLHLADSLITKKHKDDKYFEDKNAAYKGLKDQLSHYYTIAKQGGWPKITTTKKSFKKGTSAPEIAVLKKRLQISGDLAGNDTSTVFHDTLATAIKNFQIRHGYTPTGDVNEALLKDLNVSAMDRLEQILMNMDRMRWQAAEPAKNMIVVNIPEFILHAYENGKEVFNMVVVVGKEGHNTMMFNGDLNQVVFSPYWNVPSSIVKSEILPAMNRNSNYLAGQNMEIVSNEGGLPVVRQRPGTKNALGKVKFLFPNSFNIYFHDTPSKSLFEKDKRAYSHGCIRLKEPEKMANYVLRNQSEWTPEKINEAMNAGDEKFVKVKNPIPVIITYYTAWVDDNGLLHFRDDIYGHDSSLAKKMFTSAKSFTASK
ncbi:MAG: L,D-transpeptidase family protein [Chitinophagaceae bacterium]|nr:L,D-transpeptidase family protein [Chitinophagaceae bacterium]